MQLICDIASLWGDTIESAKRAISLLRQAGVTYVKFQFCKAENGNIPLPFEYFEPLMTYGNGVGANVSCSVWCDAGFSTLRSCGARWVKLAHSTPRKWLKPCLEKFDQVVLTNRQTEQVHPADNRINLWTYEASGVPQYPVMCHVDHRGLYRPDGVYDGFSNHVPNYYQVMEAFAHGASWVEVHANPLGIEGPPDARFALDLNEVKFLTKWMKKKEKEHAETNDYDDLGQIRRAGVGASGVISRDLGQERKTVGGGGGSEEKTGA